MYNILSMCAVVLRSLFTAKNIWLLSNKVLIEVMSALFSATISNYVQQEFKVLQISRDNII